MLRGSARDEAVRGFRFHAAPRRQIVMRGGEAARLYGLGRATALSRAACGTGLPSASATAHASAIKRVKAAVRKGVRNRQSGDPRTDHHNALDRLRRPCRNVWPPVVEP
jgi:hypothetical protein